MTDYVSNRDLGDEDDQLATPPRPVTASGGWTGMPLEEAAFQAALSFTLRWEGGRVDDPADHGGRTAFGITQRRYDQWRADHQQPPADVWTIYRSEVEAIYHAGYWHGGSGCDRLVGALSGGADVAGAQFDCAVHSGPARAVRILQAALESLGATLVIDGLFGAQTLAAVIGVSHVPNLVDAMCAERARFLAGIVSRDPTQQRFANGWYARVAAVRRTYAGRE